MPIAKTQSCPRCASTFIRETNSQKPNSFAWKCRDCKAEFNQPVQKTRRKSNGSGVVAPRSYRAQMAFDAMQLTDPASFRPVPAPSMHSGKRTKPGRV